MVVCARSSRGVWCSGLPLGALPLLPLVARDRLAGGPLVYGLLLGAFGLGALGGAFAVHRLRRRYGVERVLTGAGVFGGALLVLGLMPSSLPAVTVALRSLALPGWARSRPSTLRSR